MLPGLPEARPGKQLQGPAAAAKEAAISGSEVCDEAALAPGALAFELSRGRESCVDNWQEVPDQEDMGMIQCLDRYVEEEAAAPAAGGKRFGTARMRRRAVAEENYRLRHSWVVPRTVSHGPDELPRSSPSSPFHCLCVGCPCMVPTSERTLVSFSSCTTADAVVLLTNLRQLSGICVHNFANGRAIGGGYKTGAQAQEEDLCRRIPNLYPSLLQAEQEGLYPFGPSTYSSRSSPGRYSHVLFTPGTVLARLGEEEDFGLLDPGQQIEVSVVTAAAPNVNFARDFVDYDLMMETVRSIFEVPKALQPSLKVLVLGSWGCGAFGGDAAQISRLFASALEDASLGGLYDEVHFAIPGSGRGASIWWHALQERGISIVELDTEAWE